MNNAYPGLEEIDSFVGTLSLPIGLNIVGAKNIWHQALSDKPFEKFYSTITDNKFA